MKLNFNSFSPEEAGLAQAIIFEFNKRLVKESAIETSLRLGIQFQNEPPFNDVPQYFSKTLAIQLKLSEILNSVGINNELQMQIPISKFVYKKLTREKKIILVNLFNSLTDNLGSLKPIGTSVLDNIISNKLL